MRRRPYTREVPESDIYRRSREATSALYESLGAERLGVVVAETPAWTVRDVLGHLVGGAEDHLTGNDEGAPGPEWTAAHVARFSDRPVDELLGLWSEIGPRLETRIADDPRAWTFVVHDVWTHEHDIRSAVGSTRRSDDVEALEFAAGAVWAFERKCMKADLRVPTVVAGDHVPLVGSGRPVVRFADLHELGRTLFGRRSEAQVRALDWSGDPDPYVPLISFFPFPADDLHG